MIKFLITIFSSLLIVACIWMTITAITSDWYRKIYNCNFCFYYV